MNSVLKTQLISAAFTFVTAFVVSLGAQLTSGAITPDHIAVSVVVGVLYVAARAAIKALAAFYAPVAGRVKAAFTTKGVTAPTKKATKRRK